MKKVLFLLSVALVALQVTAANVDRVVAQQKAEAFLKAHAVNGKLLSSGPIAFKSVYSVPNSSNMLVSAYHIFNTEDQFVIVSGDDRGEQILGHGEGNLDLDKIPCNMKVWLKFYQNQIEYLQAHPGLVVHVQEPVRAQTVSPLLKANWDQTSPYYNDCVISGTQCVTGCPATSLAQVFYYWKYPSGPTGTVPGYRCHLTKSTGTSYVNVAALPSITFDWANMKNSYSYSSTNAQKAAVAALMRYIGQKEHMEYGYNGSGISSDSTVLIANACKFFGYDSNVRAIKKTNYYGYQTYYTDAQWATLIQGELEAGHPIVYCAISDEGSGGGHAFNVDGYTATTNKYHINWGWSGYGNGDFALNAFTDYDGMTFDIYQQMVIGIQPPGGQVTFPVLTVDADTLDFGTTNTGQTVTRTFHVSGSNLLGDITIARSGNGSYSVSPETLTAAQVEAGATITVTYAPTVAGTQTANILVSGGAAETMTVRCTGTAVAVPYLEATPSELSMTANVGETVTATYTVKGYNITGTTYLSVQNAGGVFTINKSNITKANIVNGVEVTVTYKPKAPGVKNARVMMRSAGADTIYVDLTGTATLQKFTPVMLDPIEDYITASSFRADWTDETAAAGVTSYTLECYQNGQPHSVFTDITDKYYTVTNLTPSSTYYYKVKALYVDGTESAWSNIKSVTLHQGHAFAVGDVNHDGEIGIADVTMLIDYLLGIEPTICEICANVNGDSDITIDDVTALIDFILGA